MPIVHEARGAAGYKESLIQVTAHRAPRATAVDVQVTWSLCVLQAKKNSLKPKAIRLCMTLCLLQAKKSC